MSTPTPSDEQTETNYPRAVDRPVIAGMNTPADPNMAAAGIWAGGQLDVTNLNADGTFHIDNWIHIAVGQFVWLFLEGKKADGSEHNLTLWQPPSAKVNDTWLNQGYYTKAIALSYLKALGHGSTLRVVFKAAFSKSEIESEAKSFPVSTYQVINTPLDLPAPSVQEASGSSLDPMAATANLTVLVPDYGMQSTDQYSVTWAGVAGEGSHTSAYQPVGTVGAKAVRIPVALIAFNLGKRVTVTYTVIRGDVTKVSAPLSLDVQLLSGTNLPAPLLSQAESNGQGGTLYLAEVMAGGTIRINAWPHIARGQTVWLRLEGKNGSGADHNTTLWQAPNQVSDKWVSDGYTTISVPSNYLQALGTNSTLRIVFKVAFDRSQVEGSAVPFSLRTYTVVAALDDLTDDFRQTNQGPWNGWARGSATSNPANLLPRLVDGNSYLTNDTNGDSNLGVVLSKTYRLHNGKKYEFSFSIKRENSHHGVAPRLSASAKTEIITNRLITNTAWLTLKGTFVMSGESVAISISSHETSGIGNDYSIDNLRLRQIASS